MALQQEMFLNVVGCGSSLNKLPIVKRHAIWITMGHNLEGWVLKRWGVNSTLKTLPDFLCRLLWPNLLESPIYIRGRNFLIRKSKAAIKHAFPYMPLGKIGRGGWPVYLNDASEIQTTPNIVKINCKINIPGSPSTVGFYPSTQFWTTACRKRAT